MVKQKFGRDGEATKDRESHTRQRPEGERHIEKFKCDPTTNTFDVTPNVIRTKMSEITDRYGTLPRIKVILGGKKTKYRSLKLIKISYTYTLTGINSTAKACLK